MAKSSGKSLVIVESPAKARTISKFLGSSYQVEASIGHVRDLPEGKKDVPEKFKEKPWAYLGVNVDEGFEPLYIVPTDKKKQVTKLRAALKDAENLYLATDEDREGEAISWHLHELLKPKVPVHRLVFHEITKEAISDALEHTRQIDAGLVRAQETRRIIDRLYGYDMSQLLWRKVGSGTSAGRVQSVAVRLIVERERERIAFVRATYWDIDAVFKTESGESMPATLTRYQNQRVPSGKDFDSATGKPTRDDLLLLSEQQTNELAEKLRSTAFSVTKVEVKPFSERPRAPFTTSTLQQEANRKLGFGAKRTMTAAQKLYENGYITYMRTDSTILSKEAISAARSLVRSEYGENYLHPDVRVYKGKVKNAQEAHEAIRPAGTSFRLPESVRSNLDNDQFRLYDLIWKRTVACQMADAKKQRISVVVEGGEAAFTATGTSILFEGFLRAYVEGSDNPEAELADKERLLPNVQENDSLDPKTMDPKSHTTQPPARFTEASLTRTLEEKGIGRPSTFASIIGTITDERRNYIYKKGNALVPSWRAFSVTRLMEEHFGTLVDYQFTADMEDFLDSISRNEGGSEEYLRRFYFGDAEDVATLDDPNMVDHNVALKPRLEKKLEEIDPRKTARFLVGVPTEGEFREEVFVRVGKYGPFLEQGERKAPIPDGMPPDELDLAKALELLEAGQIEDEPLGNHPETGKPIYVKIGRFGPYIQLGEPDDPEKKNQSLLKGMTAEDITLETACKLLELPRNLGNFPDNDQPIEAFDGRYGPYVKCEKETRSLPDGVSPLEVTLEEAIKLLREPKRRGRAAPKEPLKVFENKSPVTEGEVKVLDGRYGPYVTDGDTNASLPKGTEPKDLTFESALDLLAERAAKGGSKKKKKKATKKKATKKKAAKKKASKKKGVKKKTTKKKATKKKATKKKA
ncbi:type I DNA topoisomerase [Rhodopirellula sp. MGV]|uniref:type I DNA topoisomerase n=1 Tax=Rhodopirellula sp. MGV TaxID=2023130 RepID=UPI000B977649|nr:type I DNA topoisomerase [Rhodopirellula sp. MGV]OYP34550.1 DNA topoisomerase I [Rhodopirellula sp. MGV]PNY36734.1 type I DNA topoisomerase [Rhodopirellula baltica]